MYNFQIFIVEILILIFLIIIFFQSGIDKILDWKGNIERLKVHLQKTLVKNLVSLLLGKIILLELLTGVFCLVGLFQIMIFGKVEIAFSGAVLSGITLLILLLGQRLAKDYQGAMTIAVYFVPVIFLVFLLNLYH